MKPQQTPSPEAEQPTGHFETHSLDRSSWRSTPTARSLLTETEMARAIDAFQEDVMMGTDGRATREYQVRRRKILVEQEPWEAIPTITMKETRKETRKTQER